MDLADKFSVLKLNAPLHKYKSYSYYSQAPPIEFISDNEIDDDNRIKANKPLKRARKINVKKSKFQDDVVYYSSGGEVSDGEHSGLDSEIAIDHEWRAFCSKRAEIKAAKAAALAAALATAQTAQTA
ncbi:hypothetical protein M378DRAFT_12402 [Amanita muscaria Koide BX008]|uniref:Uncharacterized protein n=1 Tax=Amanita muscaria (strain Koide BX008) TaxID=946122 RepID=A0A0C2T8T6_AMAMK|nr:hypothetical protein M378DRAFT_12402 [Amanita muscaria Koide BX008]